MTIRLFLRSISIMIPAAILALLASAASAQSLESYVKAKDASFAWEYKRSVPFPKATADILHLTSHTWQGIAWRHRLVVIRPEKLDHPECAVLLIAGGSNREKSFDKMPGEALLLAQLAVKTGSAIALLAQVPNQPLFGGLNEDALISHSFQKFLETGDPTWPLLLPMTKSAVKAMDAVQAYLSGKGQNVEKFFVTGASKRGWTTWLTGAVDGRVVAIAPMVIDVLRFGPQMRHQLKAWGKYSKMIHDYDEKGLLDLITGKAAAPLLDMVDPFVHRKKLTMPKLIFIGTNDPYWPVDAARLYFFDLPGEKYIHYVPNAGHGLDLSIVVTLAGFYRQILIGSPRPEFDWHVESFGGKAQLVVRTKTVPVKVEAWRARSKLRDFREARWTSVPMDEGARGSFVHAEQVPGEGEGYVALYAALTFKNAKGEPFILCTNAEVFPETLPGRK